MRCLPASFSPRPLPALVPSLYRVLMGGACMPFVLEWCRWRNPWQRVRLPSLFGSAGFIVHRVRGGEKIPLLGAIFTYRMHIEQLYTNCLSEAAYYIESEGEAAIVDPIRETQPYLDMLAARGTKLKYVFETHFHADFVSGHIDLAKATGAQIVYGPDAQTGYNIRNAADGEFFALGSIQIQALHTPGHTLESTCYLVLNESGAEEAILTGDTLFVGDVGRPDLLSGKMTSEDLAGMLYDSLHKHILTRPDDLTVYPAHGPGSACGKNIGKETFTTIGEQRRTNYALKPQTRERFIQTLTTGLSAPPRYFFNAAEVNATGYEAYADVMERSLKALPLPAFEAVLAQGALILDTRNADVFAAAFIPNSTFVGLDGQFAIWVGTLLDHKKPLLVVADEGREEEAVRRLARVGFENVAGYLQGGFAAWQAAGKPTDHIDNIEAEAYAALLEAGAFNTLDVRREGEYEAGHVAGATLLPLALMDETLGGLSPAQPYAIHCAGGYRSLIAASILRQHGFKQLANVRGGYTAIKRTNVPMEMPQTV